MVGGGGTDTIAVGSVEHSGELLLSVLELSDAQHHRDASADVSDVGL